jgi:methylenetetrahydrofolate dehydrogenase (NADP+)/methenyltetrahydrofolate cyclohydrolase
MRKESRLSATIIDGKKIADEIKREVKAGADRLKVEKSIVPGLAFILVGDNPASHVYVRMKRKACEEMGFYSVTIEMSGSTDEKEVLEKVGEFNRDRRIHGILVQLPLPDQISEEDIVEAIDPRKDVDGLHPMNVGKLAMGELGFRPCTPVGVQELLLRSGNDPAGKHVVVLGRSNLVGRPLANILSQKQPGANAVVTVCHTGARDISIYTKQADILVAAMGKAEIITGDMIKPGAVVIDVGTNRVDDPSAKSGYRLVGDVHFDSASKVASAITPVPGGVGPMTIAVLLRNTLEAAEIYAQAR